MENLEILNTEKLFEQESFDDKTELRRLIRSISLAEKYFLFFAVCNQIPKQQNLVKQIKKEFPDGKIAVIEFNKPINSLLSELRKKVKRKNMDAIFVLGLRYSIPSAKKGKETTFIADLNISRDAFPKFFNCPLILFLPEYAVSKLMNGAFDFSSVRSGAFFFKTDEKILSQQISQAITIDDEGYETLRVEEREKRIEHLKELLVEYETLPEEKRDFDIEVELKEKLASLYYKTGNFSEARELRNLIVTGNRKIKEDLTLGNSAIRQRTKFLGDYFPSATTYFTGRSDVIEQIAETLKKHRTASLHGISGLGKTSVLLEYAKRFAGEYEHIIFVRAVRNGEVSSFARLAETIDETAENLPNDAAKAQRFRQWLEENSGWLLLIDNVDEPSAVRPLLPVNPRGHILSTGRSATLTILGNEVAINKMNAENGALLIYRRAKTLAGLTDDEIKTRLQGEPEAERNAVENLVRELDGLPLALNLAGAYIHGFNKKFAEYENLYRKSAQILLAAQDINDDYQNDSVALAFSLAFDEIAKPENDTPEAKEIADAAILFLKTAAFLANQAMPHEIFTKILAADSADGANRSVDERFLDKVFAKIAQFDLFEKDSDAQTYDIHRLVQFVVYNKIEPTEKTELCTKILEILIDLFPKYDYFNKPACERFAAHCETVLEKSEKLNLINKDSNELYYRIARFQQLQGNFAQAEKFYHQDLTSAKQIYGTDSNKTAARLNNLANVYYSQGRYDEAIELYQEFLQTEEKTIGKEHPDYASGLNNLGNVYYSQSKYDKAIELFKQALLIEEKTIGKEHSDYAIGLNNLANVYVSQGRYDEAVEFYQQALLIGEQTIGKEHPDYATRLNNLASVYQNQGRYDEAVEIFKQALLIDEKTIGKEHPQYANHLNNLALVYQSQGKYDEAVELLKESLRIFIKFLGENHPSTQTVRGNLESCLAESGEKG